MTRQFNVEYLEDVVSKRIKAMDTERLNAVKLATNAAVMSVTRNRRFLSRISKTAIESVEAKVERILNEALVPEPSSEIKYAMLKAVLQIARIAGYSGHEYVTISQEELLAAIGDC